MVELTQSQIDRFADYKASYLPAEIGSGPAFKAHIGRLVGSVVDLAKPGACSRRQAFFKSPLSAQEFRERVVLEDASRVAIGGIRFRNLDPTFPFVEVNANFDLLEPATLQNLAMIAGREFAAFEPKGVLLAGPPDVYRPELGRWSHVVCGRAASARGELPVGLTCSFPGTADFDDAYRAAHAEWQARSPGLRDFVRVEPRGDLEAAAAAGLLLSCHDDIGWCGVVAAREQPLYGTPALYIFEIFLVERWRGKGAGKAVDAALVSSAAGRYPLVWEHIHSTNWPSLRIALAQGRSVVETDYFLAFDG